MKSNRLAATVFLAGLAIALAASPARGGTPIECRIRYHAHEITSLTNTFASPVAINNRSQMVGYRLINALTLAVQAFRLSENGPTQDLVDLGGELGSIAFDINDRGSMVGASNLPNTNPDYLINHAVFWRTDGHIQDLGTLGGDRSAAFALNLQGWIVGWSSVDENRTEPFVWLPFEDRMYGLGTLGGDYGAAFDINGLGQVVGRSSTGTEDHAFLWVPGDTALRDLGTLGGSESSAVSINDRGQIVGNSAISDGNRHAFFWSDGRMRDLGTLGGANSFAAKIDTWGRTVGLSEITPAPGELVGAEHAFVWSERCGMQDLNALTDRPLPYVLKEASINDRGQIVAGSVLDDGGHWYLLSPFFGGFLSER